MNIYYNSPLCKKTDEKNKAVKGFLLSRHWHDNKDGLQLVFWVLTEYGPAQILISTQNALFFVEQQDIPVLEMLLMSEQGWQLKVLNLKTFQQKSVAVVYFNKQRDMYRNRELLRRNNITVFESDIKPTDRFLMERFITAALDIEGIEQNKLYFKHYLNPKLSPAEYYPKFKILSLDIETSLKADQLYSIAIYGQDVKKVWMIGKINKSTSKVDFLDNERTLLQVFLEWIQDYDPDILIGWNVINFDLRVLQNKADELAIDFRIGRDRQPADWYQARDNPDHYTLTIPGRLVLDGIDTLRSATYQFESFSLEFVAQQLLQRGKLITHPEDRGQQIQHLFHHDKPALAAYNLEDCRLVWEIFELRSLVDFAAQRALQTGLAMDRFGGSVAAFDFLYLPRLHRQSYIAPNIPEDPVGMGSPGGYVMESTPGLYDYVLVLDFKSLYPSIIRTFKIDPMGLAEGLNGELTEDDKLKGFNGAVFSKSKSLLPDIISSLWRARDNAKKDQNMPLSQALKIIMNSFYGVLGTSGCRFFDFRLPSSITLRGHEILNKTREYIENKGYTVIYGDTDSVFVWVNGCEKYAEAHGIGKQLSQDLNQWWRQELNKKFQIVSHLEIEYETLFTKFLMPTIRGSDRGSKKRYAGMIKTADGCYEIIFKGLEAVRTDWTLLAREFQKSLYTKVFNNEPYLEYILQIIEDIRQGKCDDKLIYRKRIRRALCDYTAQIPPHVHAARIAENELVKQGLPSFYANGGWIEYVMTINGAEPLSFLKSAIDYERYIERQIAPIVDGIISFGGKSFEEITSQQIDLF